RAGSRGGRTVPSGGFDQPVAAVAAAVDDLDLVRAGVPEDEEVVADELERLDGLLRCHRAEDELLRLHDLRSAVGGRRGRLGCAAVAAPALLAVADHLPFELDRQQVDGCAHVGGGLPRAENRTLRPYGRLRDLVRSDRRVALDGELELDARQVVQLALELRKLLLGVLAERVRDLDVPAVHLKSHLRSPWSSGRS